MTNEERLAKLEANHETNLKKITNLEQKVDLLTQKDNDIIIKENQKLVALEKSVIKHNDESADKIIITLENVMKKEVGRVEQKVEEVEQKVDNTISRINNQDERIVALENAPKDKALERQTWIIVTLLGILVSLVGTLLQKILFN